jgi:RNA polymerase sigma-70 factor, ECF subfamily
MTQTILCEVDQDRPDEKDSSLVEAAQAGLAGFKRLYLRWLPPVYRYFYFRVGNEKEAEDLTSQVFLRVYEELPRYRDRGQFPAWLFAIVRNRAIDYFRTRSREISLESVDLPDGTYDLLTQAIHSTEIERLRGLILALPEEDQELIRLRFVVELGYREIGAVLHRKEDAVRKSITRLLARLQSQLEVRHD